MQVHKLVGLTPDMGAFVWRKRRVSNAVKLTNHVKSAHNGVFNPQCLGCLELSSIPVTQQTSTVAGKL